MRDPAVFILTVRSNDADVLKSCELDTYPYVPSPASVLCKERFWPVTELISESDDIYPVAPRFLIVDRSWDEDIYPAVPNPRVVEVSCDEDIYPNDARLLWEAAALALYSAVVVAAIKA